VFEIMKQVLIVVYSCNFSVELGHAYALNKTVADMLRNMFLYFEHTLKIGHLGCVRNGLSC